MKRILVIALFGAILADITSAQDDDWIGVFSDQAATRCHFLAPIGEVFYVHVFHMHTYGSTSSQFKLNTGGMNWLNAGEVSPYNIAHGSSADGVLIEYGSCRAGTFLIMTITFFAFGYTPSCTEIRVLASSYAASGRIEAIDCAGNTQLPGGGDGVVNPGGGCHTTCFKYIDVPVKRTTWGKVKALYD